MSLCSYLKEKKIDEIRDHYGWQMAQYNAVYEYCKENNFNLSPRDMEFLIDRGYGSAFNIWKKELY